jgi:P27 family predicted phage terminase small subunit
MANPPKPSHLKAVQGTDRRDRKNDREPQPEKGAPPVPAHLTPEELIEWGRCCERLQKLGVLTEADGLALEQLCVLIVEVRRLTKIVRDNETQKVTTTQKEQVDRAHPLWQQLQQSRKELRALWTCFGLDPSARTRVHTVQTNNGNKPAQAPPRAANAYLD